MARPTKWRRIENMPRTTHFTPGNGRTEGENVLKLEELEALRLKDLEGLEQEECASRMQVSRPTFQRILITARQKVADSLSNGRAIRIEGGRFTRQICPVTCLDCNHTWEESVENIDAIRQGEFICPSCGSQNLSCGRRGRGGTCRRNCRRFGRQG